MKNAINKSILLATLIVIPFACSNNEQGIIHYGEDKITRLFNKGFEEQKRKFGNPNVSVFMPDSQVGMLGCGDSLFLLEKLYMSLEYLSDTILVLQKESNGVSLFYNKNSDGPFAIVLESVDNSKEIAVGKNVLLRKRVHDELKIDGIEEYYFYISEELADNVKLGKKNVVFVNANCEKEYQKVLVKYGYSFIVNHSYSSEREVLAKVVFIKR